MMTSTYKRPSRRVKLAGPSFSARFFRSRELYALLIIPVVYLALFHYYPMYGAQIAFKDFKAGLGIAGSPWVGFRYFIRFFSSYQFVRIVGNTLALSAYTLFIAFFARIFLALMINAVKNSFFKKSVQMITYMPHFISTVVIVGMIVQFLNPRIGMLSKAMQFFGGTDRDLMGIPEAFSHIYAWSGVWQSVGWGTIIFLAALSSVDPSLHEAAIIDGANRFQRIRFIDIPVIIPTAVILLILDAGRIMNVGFEKVFLMQNNLNLSSSEVISTYVYKMGIGGGTTVRTDFSYGTAIGLFNSIVNFALVVSVNRVSRTLNNTSLW